MLLITRKLFISTIKLLFCFVEYFVDIDEGLECHTKPTVLISPVIPALLSALKSLEESSAELVRKKSVKLFVLRLLVHLLHLQVSVKSLLVFYPTSLAVTTPQTVKYLYQYSSHRQPGGRTSYLSIINFFFQSHTKGLITLLKKYSSCCIDRLFYEYLDFWGNDKLEPNADVNPLSDEETFCRFSEVILEPECAIEVNICQSFRKNVSKSSN